MLFMLQKLVRLYTSVWFLRLFYQRFSYILTFCVLLFPSPPRKSSRLYRGNMRYCHFGLHDFSFRVNVKPIFEPHRWRRRRHNVMWSCIATRSIPTQYIYDVILLYFIFSLVVVKTNSPWIPLFNKTSPLCYRVITLSFFVILYLYNIMLLFLT